MVCTIKLFAELQNGIACCPNKGEFDTPVFPVLA